jgi:large subunit ribosomal protein L29
VSSAHDFRNLSDAELVQKLHEAHQELMNLRFRLATKQLDNTSRLRVVRLEIARLETVKRERELAA